MREASRRSARSRVRCIDIRLRWYLRCAALQGAKPRSGDTTEYAEALLAWAETYSQSGNAYIYKCDRFAVDGKPVGRAGPESRAGPEGRAANAKGRMQPMP